MYRFPVRKCLRAIAGLMILVGSCANPVAPTGGPKDENPPEVIGITPPDKSVNFRAAEIVVRFDEFIRLKDLQQQFLSSPPFRSTPEIKTRGKSLIIKLQEELRENTTYTLYFGNSIVDLNENNPFSGFKYVFSTGAVLDSLSIRGRVVNAQNRLAEKDVSVMLYDTYGDSIPIVSGPYYLSRTDKDGFFSFSNLRDIPYKIFALKDLNNNLLFDLPNEQIAFADMLIHPIFIPGSGSATSVAGDSVGSKPNRRHKLPVTPAAELPEDTLSIAPEFVPITLRLFAQADTLQRIEKSTAQPPHRIDFVFRYPVSDLRIEMVDQPSGTVLLQEWNDGLDSLVCWLQHLKSDSLKLILSEHKPQPDTFEFSLIRKPAPRSPRLPETPARLSVATNIPRGQPIGLNIPIQLTFSEPLADFKEEKITLLEDSIRVKPSFRFVSGIQRKLTMTYPWKEAKTYQILIPDSSFVGIYGLANDTLVGKFNTRKAQDYGLLKLQIENKIHPIPLVILLLDEQENILSQHFVAEAERKLVFPYMLPGKYLLKAIADRNNNGRWDAGNYLRKVQPEDVFYYPEKISVRANWELEETFRPFSD